jgi:hypothetical protein
MPRKRWIDLYEQKATYISEVFDVRSVFESYIENLMCQYDLNDGTVQVFIRISYDNETWTDWVQVNDAVHGPLFRNDFYYMENCRMQYKVEMINNGEVSPTFISFSYSLIGCYLLDNRGDVVCKPELWIKKINSNGTVRITNESNTQMFELKDLNVGETVYVDCENEDIVSDLPLTYRYDNHNNVFLELEVGENILTGEGEFELIIRHEFKTLQG